MFLTQSGWSYSEISKFPIKKRDWIFEMFITIATTEVPEEN